MLISPSSRHDPGCCFKERWPGDLLKPYMFLKREMPQTDDFGKRKKLDCEGKILPISIFQEITRILTRL